MLFLLFLLQRLDTPLGFRNDIIALALVSFGFFRGARLKSFKSANF